MHIDSGDSYGVQRVPDTRKTTKIPLPNSFPSKNPTTIPGVPKNYGYRGPKHRHVVDIFQKYFTHNLPTHYTNGSVSQNRISRIFNFSIIPPIQTGVNKSITTKSKAAFAAYITSSVQSESVSRVPSSYKLQATSIVARGKSDSAAYVGTSMYTDHHPPRARTSRKRVESHMYNFTFDKDVRFISPRSKARTIRPIRPPRSLG